MYKDQEDIKYATRANESLLGKPNVIREVNTIEALIFTFLNIYIQMYTI